MSFLRPVNLWPWPRRWSCSVLRTLATTSKLVQFCGLSTTSTPFGSGTVGAAGSAMPALLQSHGPTSRCGAAVRPSSSAPRLACRGPGSMPPTRKDSMLPRARAASGSSRGGRTAEGGKAAAGASYTRKLRECVERGRGDPDLIPKIIYLLVGTRRIFNDRTTSLAKPRESMLWPETAPPGPRCIRFIHVQRQYTRGAAAGAARRHRARRSTREQHAASRVA